MQVSTADIAGGAEGSAWNLFKSYQQRGHLSWLVVGDKYSDDKDVLLIPDYGKKQNIWVGFWGRLATLVKPYRTQSSSAMLIWKICKRAGRPQIYKYYQSGIENFDSPGTSLLLTLANSRPDIVHCHNLHGDYFDLRQLPELSKEVPVVLNLRDAWLLSGHCAHSFDCNRWQIGCGQCPYLNTYPAIKKDSTHTNWLLKRDIYARSRLYITTISHWLMDKVNQSMLPGVKHKVIYNGIDTSIFKPGIQKEARSLLGLPAESNIILLTSHNEFKDYPTMEASLKMLTQSFSGNLLFICLGTSGSEKVIGNGRFIYPGRIKLPEKLATYYRAADIFIHAARAEAFGKMITEAMACGTPVVATAVGGIPEQIQDGITGRLTPPNDPKSMAQAIQDLLTDTDLRIHMGRECVKDINNRFSHTRQVNEFLTWYEEILEDWKTYHAFTDF